MDPTSLLECIHNMVVGLVTLVNLIHCRRGLHRSLNTRRPDSLREILQAGYHAGSVIICIYVNTIIIIDTTIKNDDSLVNQREMVHTTRSL